MGENRQLRMPRFCCAARSVAWVRLESSVTPWLATSQQVVRPPTRVRKRVGSEEKSTSSEYRDQGPFPPSEPDHGVKENHYHPRERSVCWVSNSCSSRFLRVAQHCFWDDRKSESMVAFHAHPVRLIVPTTPIY